MSGYTLRTFSYLLGSEFQDGQPNGSIQPVSVRDFIGTMEALTASGQVFTSGASVTMSNTQLTLVVRKSPAGPTAVTLPTSPVQWLPYTVKDGLGDAATNNITVSSAALVDSLSSAVISAPFAALSFVFDGTTWNIV